eukprot:311946-Chlamydomonas_euryale.AAC.3
MFAWVERGSCGQLVSCSEFRHSADCWPSRELATFTDFGTGRELGTCTELECARSKNLHDCAASTLACACKRAPACPDAPAAAASSLRASRRSGWSAASRAQLSAGPSSRVPAGARLC